MCHCCTTAIKRRTNWHCESDWDKFHNKGWINGMSDWLNYEEYKRKFPNEEEIFTLFENNYGEKK